VREENLGLQIQSPVSFPKNEPDKRKLGSEQNETGLMKAKQISFWLWGAGGCQGLGGSKWDGQTCNEEHCDSSFSHAWL